MKKTRISYCMMVMCKNVVTRLKGIGNVKLLNSNPCIEVWFLFHYKNQTAHVNFAYCKKELENQNGSYKRGVIDRGLEDKLICKRVDASRRAKSLADFTNPGSTIYKFIDLLDELKGPGL